MIGECGGSPAATDPGQGQAHTCRLAEMQLAIRAVWVCSAYCSIDPVIHRRRSRRRCDVLVLQVCENFSADPVDLPLLLAHVHGQPRLGAFPTSWTEHSRSPENSRMSVRCALLVCPSHSYTPGQTPEHRPAARHRRPLGPGARSGRPATDRRQLRSGASTRTRSDRRKKSSTGGESPALILDVQSLISMDATICWNTVEKLILHEIFLCSELEIF
jgi:hypothetical protein